MKIIASTLTLLLLSCVGLGAPEAKKKSCQTAGCHENLGNGHFQHKPMKSERGCRVCHVEIKPGEGQSHPVLKKTDVNSVNGTCFLCHEEVKHSLSGAKSVHDAINDKSCIGCHDPHRGQTQKLLKSSDIVNLCLDCHKNFGKKHVKGSRHRISEMKNACLNCHDPHASRVNERLFRAANKKDLCLKCHEKDMASWMKLAQDQLHKPVVEGECQSCHKIHGSDQKALLALDYDLKTHSDQPMAGAQLCLKCHKDFLSTTVKSKVETKFRNGTTNLHDLHVNTGKKKRNCSACHDPHGSDQGSLVRSGFEYSGYQVALKYQKTKSGGTCATACHKSMAYDRDQAVKNEPDP